ncbi:MAG: DUF3048 domain-containing protein [Acidimicrobiales bacterium]
MAPLRPSRRARLPAVLVAAALLGAGCSSGGDDAAGGSDTTAEETTTTTAVPVLAPLTGLVLDDGDVADRPAVTVKVDNGPQGRPQSGIDKADVLIEEKVEGGITRFLSVFHSEDATLIGPVRSVRSTDPGLIGTFGGVFAFAGGIPEFERQARQQPVTVVSESASSQGFQYRADKQRPFKTYTSTAKLRSLARDHDRPPPTLFEFLPAGQPFAPAGAVPATSATVSFGRTTVALQWDATGGVWKRSTNGTPHTVEGGAQLTFTNVIIQKTPYVATRFRDPSGARVDEAQVVGSGDAVVLSQGKRADVQWAKASPTSVTTYTDSTGRPVQLARGQTLIALPPTAGGSVTVT